MPIPVAIQELAPVPSESLQDVRIDGMTYTHTDANTNSCAMHFNPVITSGIVKMDIINMTKLEGVGIADESVHFDRTQNPLKYGIYYLIYLIII
ncbi:MAG: hypothetical protein EZS28_043180 [Streblomastix strix]|uniref:Uncharacterized protein n=1 Tax=Streblomastix strix TaxID=222440 RepID=A0A5J4TTS0_9EUKA|nr:MAG: hypothetical protein EZS28_043180 [Streblomastix strix]